MSAISVLTPGDLQKIAEEETKLRMQQQLSIVKKKEDEEHELRESFMSRDIHPEVMNRLNAVIKRAAAQGLREVQVMTFPASYCNDHGRRINNSEPDWPESLEGFAKKAQDFYEKELRPLGFKTRARILNYPDGKLGDVGLFLSW